MKKAGDEGQNIEALVRISEDWGSRVRGGEFGLLKDRLRCPMGDKVW